MLRNQQDKYEFAAESRRDFLAGPWGRWRRELAGNRAGGGIIVAARSHNTSKLTQPKRIIDVHHHIMPPFYVHEHRRDQMKVGPGITQIFEWTPQQAIERMDAGGVAGRRSAFDFGRRARGSGRRKRGGKLAADQRLCGEDAL